MKKESHLALSVGVRLSQVRAVVIHTFGAALLTIVTLEVSINLLLGPESSHAVIVVVKLSLVNGAVSLTGDALKIGSIGRK